MKSILAILVCILIYGLFSFGFDIFLQDWLRNDVLLMYTLAKLSCFNLVCVVVIWMIRDISSETSGEGVKSGR